MTKSEPDGGGGGGICGGGGGGGGGSGKDGGGGVSADGGGKRFKGIENFLKRVAFNLGNTPSQTEVKIISCIPIDVSDLQQKILHLERELEDTKSFNARGSNSQKRCVGQAICENRYPPISNTELSLNTFDMNNPYNNTNSNCKSAPKRKSNVSFTEPSVTPEEEYSIGSQQEVPPSMEDGRPFCESMPFDNDMKLYTATSPDKQRSGRKNFFKKKKKYLKPKKPKTTQFVYYAQTSSCSPFKSDGPELGINGDMVMTRSYLAEMIDKQYKPKPLGGNLSDISKFSSPICRDTHDISVHVAYESDICSCCHGPFQDIDKHMSQYHESNVFRFNDIITEGSGYYDSTFYDVVPVKEKPVKIKKSMDSPKRREPKPEVDIKCWPEDVRTKLRTHPIYNPLYYGPNYLLHRTEHGERKAPKTYRKEPKVNSIGKRRREIHTVDRQIGMETSKSCSIDFGRVYPKVLNQVAKVDKCLKVTVTPRKIDAQCLTTITNNSECQTDAIPLDVIQPTPNEDKTEETLHQIKNILQSVLQEVKVTAQPKTSLNEKAKKDVIIQKGVSHGTLADNTQENLQGNVQSNLHSSFQSQLPGHMPGGLSTNEPFPNSVPHMQGSRLLNSFSYGPYNINPYAPSCSKQFNNNNPYYYPPAAMKCFQHFPIFLQNHGRHMCSGCYRNSSQVKSSYGKQPTTIATNTDNVKTEHSKETQKLIKEIYKSMALNMGVLNKDNSLTELDAVRHFSSHVEKPVKKTIDKPQSVKDGKKVTNVVQVVSELFRKKDMQVSSDSPNMTAESRLVSHETSTRSQLVTSTDRDVRLRKERLEKFMNQSKRSQSEEVHKEKRRLLCTGTQNTMTPSSSESTTTSTETGSDVTFVPEHQKQAIQKERKEKKSLFSKMFKSVKLFKPKEKKKREREKEKIEVELESEESSSDSDDYQTVYSQKIVTTPKHASRAHNLPKRRTHSKIAYKQVYPRERSPEKLIRRSPYMEQEYRRYWNEKLMFHDQRHKHSSDHPYIPGHSGNSPRRAYHHSDERRTVVDETNRDLSRRPPYYQTYEARPMVSGPSRELPRKSPYHQGYETRPTIIETIKHVHKTEPVNARRIVRQKQNNGAQEPKAPSKGLTWLKRQKVRCGRQWKELILDN